VDKTTTQDPDRVALRLAPDVRRRLRLHAAITGKSVQAVLTGWIAEHLPGDAELAEAIARGGAPGEH
jgi:hypothetical protein